MSRYLEAIRELYWSDLCSTDRDAYLAYLSSVDNGVSTFSVGCVDGAAKLLRGGGGCVGDDVAVESQSCGDDVEKEIGVVVGIGSAGLVVDSQDNGDCGSGSQRFGELGGGLSVDSVDNRLGRIGDVGGDVSVGHGRCDDRSDGNSAVDAGSMVGEPVVGRGRNYYSNKKKREQRKKRAKEVRMAGSWRASSDKSDDGVDQNVPTLAEFADSRADSEIMEDKAKDVEARLASVAAALNAKTTLAKRWAVENELAMEKAQRALEVLRAQDLSVEIKRQSTRLRLQTERNMVGMEKAHQFLKNTGNVPGFAQTVLSDGGLTEGSSSPSNPGECTISPDSSASMKEFRELVKKCADLEAKLEQFHKMTKIHPDYIELYKKQTWTINSENIRILDEMYPQGHALNPIPDYENYDAPTHGELIVGRDEEYFPY